ncbi:MAG: isoleucine--tRNA ligase [Ignavibacteriales bacterium]|jgi:isoleucyl-tRNA synthetase|nr:isoleucine--tRNA ligase [Ignavibacteriales bacterium]
MYKPYPENFKYPEIENEVLKFWKEKNIFEKSVESRPADKSFTFYEGPPTANGKPGIHHVMARTLKDLICRYKTLQGYQVQRRAGWDTHGLPVEIEVEKQLGIKSKADIPIFGVEKYNDACRHSVFTYKDLWEKMTDRMGYWIDLESAYITCTNNYIESVWWSLKTLFDKGLIFKDYKIVPQDPKAETVLSSHELALGYRMTKDPSVYVLFKAKDADYHFLVWTTTPWTLISNVALALGPDIEYVKVLHKEIKMVLAKERLSVLGEDYEILESFKGSDLENVEYEQLMDYVQPDKKAFYTLNADFVSTGDGSGIVHIAPAFGQDDYDISKKYGLPMLQPVTRGGRFTAEITDFADQFVKDADAGIIQKLRAEGKLYKKETIEHSYPFSWRFDDVPIIYYARESWFIKTTSVADRMVELNKTINWAPPEIGTGRFGNWLEDNKDWALSRDRFWATPLPIWVSEDGKDMFAVGSIEDLKQGIYEKDGKRTSVSELEEIDLHKPFVDRIIFEKDGKVYRRTPELIDVWYDSGAMPFAQYHYPFENKELFEANFPADFISEGIDQTRGWFYTLHAISTMLFDSPAYKNILVNDLILDKEGKKMSKSRGNSVDPFMLFDKYGADATRWYLIANNPPWKPTLFNEDDLGDIQRKFFGTLTNTYSFFSLYANIDRFVNDKELVDYGKRPEIDRWIISKLNGVVEEYETSMDVYDVTRAARAVMSFTIDELSNWYVRRSRRRFWKSDLTEAKLSAYQTLHECLLTVSKLISPFAPFIAEDIYRRLTLDTTGAEESVHLCKFPVVTYREKELEEKMDAVQRVVYITRSMRAKHNLKVRQPLKKIMVAVAGRLKEPLETMKEVILEEVNIKDLIILTDDSGIVKKSTKPNFKTLGPKHGKSVQPVASAIREFGTEEIGILLRGENIILDINGNRVEVEPTDVEIISSEIEGWLVESEGAFTVALDTEITPELRDEGFAREFVNRVQNMRKDAGFEVIDKINIVYSGDDEIKTAVNIFQQYIKGETLAENLQEQEFGSGYTQEWKIGDHNCKIEINKI